MLKSGPSSTRNAIWAGEQGRKVALARAGRLSFWGGHGTGVRTAPRRPEHMFQKYIEKAGPMKTLHEIRKGIPNSTSTVVRSVFTEPTENI